MKTLWKALAALCILLSGALIFSSCEDECTEVVTYKIYTPIFMLPEELRQAVKWQEPRSLSTTGKIWVYDTYLLINEPHKGIHVFDNADPQNPQNLGFINIPGNVDMAVQGNYLYADSYVDMVVLDISSPTASKEVARISNAFPMSSQYGYGWFDPKQGILVDYEVREVTETISCTLWNRWVEMDATTSAGGGPRGGSSGTVGGGGSKPSTGGSMARFAIKEGFLYTVNDNGLRLFTLSDPAKPVQQGDIGIGFGIETIFPYEDKLFIGANNGMHIFSIANPASPQKLSTYAHVRSCDPVFVQGRYAYVTLRSGTACQGFTNQLEVVDVGDPAAPRLLKTYPMQNPHGLGMNSQKKLYICEGAFGLKAFDAKNHDNIQLLQHFDKMHAYDIIVFDEHLMVVGNDGLYQYVEENGKLKQISMIPVIKGN